MAGSIKLFRQFRDWEWYQDENVKSVFIELLLTANYKDLRWQGKVVKRGQLITSRAKLAAYLGKTEQNIRTALGKLQSTGEIELKATNKYTLITICKYDYWQSQNGYDQPTINQPTNQQLTNEQPTTNQQLTTSKEREEYKEREEINNWSSGSQGGQQNFEKTTYTVREYVAIKKQPLELQQLSEITLIAQSELARVLDEFALANIDEEKRTLVVWGRYFQACKDGILKRLREAKNNPKKENKNEKSYDRRRGTEVTAKTADDYKQSF